VSARGPRDFLGNALFPILVESAGKRTRRLPRERSFSQIGAKASAKRPRDFLRNALFPDLDAFGAKVSAKEPGDFVGTRFFPIWSKWSAKGPRDISGNAIFPDLVENERKRTPRLLQERDFCQKRRNGACGSLRNVIFLAERITTARRRSGSVRSAHHQHHEATHTQQQRRRHTTAHPDARGTPKEERNGKKEAAKRPRDPANWMARSQRVYCPGAKEDPATFVGTRFFPFWREMERKRPRDFLRNALFPDLDAFGAKVSAKGPRDFVGNAIFPILVGKRRKRTRDFFKNAIFAKNEETGLAFH